MSAPVFIFSTAESGNFDEDDIFSQPWNDSDVVLMVQGKEFHVHRSILSLQSPVFKAMFNGNFKDATEDKIELKDENEEAMLEFLKMLYPSNMLDEVEQVYIYDENVVEILEVADKYGAINVIKQCIKEAERLEPENTMRLLPYAARHNLPLGKIFHVITRNVSTDKLQNFAPELESKGSHSLYDECLLGKCHFLEDVTKRADATILVLLQKCVSVAPENSRNSIAIRTEQKVAKCVQHEVLKVEDFKKARKCQNCLTAYKKCFIDEHVFPSRRDRFGAYNQNSNEHNSADLTDLLKHTDDIARSLQS